MMHKPGYYKQLSEDEVAAQLSSEGAQPRRVVEQPGSRYDNHKNLHDIVMAFVAGSAAITIDGTTYQCAAGDRLHIDGERLHSALVGDEGCTYYMVQLPFQTD